MSAAPPAKAKKPAAAQAPPAEPSPYTIVVVRGEAALGEHLAAWKSLAARAAEPNAFYEPWALLPALRAFGADEPFFVLVYQPLNAQRRELVMCGFFPLVRRRLSRLCPAPVVESWKHRYCSLTVPLLRAGHAGAVLDAFFGWLKSDPLGGALWRMEEASFDGPFAHALTDAAYERQRPSFVLDAFCRALIEPSGDAEAYLRQALSGKRLKEFRRQERQLKAKGRLETRVLKAGDDVGYWADHFLRLESAGWKGREGTALGSDAAGAAFFREAVRGASAQDQLLMLGLFLDGEPIALKCNFLAGEGAFAFKIAFDERYSAQSPGALLEIANIEYLHQHRQTLWMDSCAVPDHFMINRLWTERRRIKTQYVATGRAPGDALVSLMPLGRWLKRKFRRGTAPAVHVTREED